MTTQYYTDSFRITVIDGETTISKSIRKAYAPILILPYENYHLSEYDIRMLLMKNFEEGL